MPNNNIVFTGRGIVKVNNILRDLNGIFQTSLEKIVEDAKTNASWSKKIPKAIKLGRVNVDLSNRQLSAKIILDTSIAPEAAAFEYGSGLHRKNKSPSKYVIAPKAGLFNGVLAFEWPGHNPNFPSGGKFIRALPNGKFLFWYVEHPGIQARPYLALAREKNRAMLKKELAKGFKQAFLTSIRTQVNS